MSIVHPISESEAREMLLRERSEASNTEYFDAERREHGWVFGWREDRGDIPVGTRTWIVADNGRVKMLSPTERIDTAIEHEATK
jgi:hypothetical protein